LPIIVQHKASDAVLPAYYTVEDDRKRRKVSAYQQQKEKRDGSGPPFIISGRRTLYPIAEHEEFMARLPRFNSVAEAYEQHPDLAEFAEAKRQSVANARASRWGRKSKPALKPRRRIAAESAAHTDQSKA
jgi:hypothetical protein